MQISTPTCHKRLRDLACTGFRPARSFWQENVSSGPSKQGEEFIVVYYGSFLCYLYLAILVILYNIIWHIVWTTMPYGEPWPFWWAILDHVGEGKGVHQNCLLDTLFIKWTIELIGIGHYLFLIWVASASMTATLSRSFWLRNQQPLQNFYKLNKHLIVRLFASW